MASSLGLASPRSPSARSPATTYSGFHLPSSPSGSEAGGGGVGSDSDSGDDMALPFPTALARRDFLVADFHAPTYLSSLFPSDAETTSAHRHQTLEDLRAELRERSGAISAELLDLVNANYTNFLSLGDELKGGGDRVEDVRVALLGFRRAVEDVRARVAARRVDVAAACADLGAVRSDIDLGRRMLELDERLRLLEGRLAVGSLPGGGRAANGHDGGGFGIEESDDDDVADDEDVDLVGMFVASSPAKLMGLARDMVVVEALADSVGRELPFVRKMEERMARCRNTIFLDLQTAIRESRKAGPASETRTLRFLAIYRLLGGRSRSC